MIILHAGIHNSAVIFWAETSNNQGTNGKKDTKQKNNAKSKNRSQMMSTTKHTSRHQTQDNDIKQYKFAATSHQLKEILKSIGIDVKRTTTKNITLPTSLNDDSPIPSNDLILDYMEPLEETKNTIPKSQITIKNKVNLKKWAINVVELDTKDAITLLSHVMGKRVIQHGVLVGADIAHIADMMRMSGALVARQQYLPDIVKDNKKHIAMWSPIISGVDSKRFRNMRKHMPSAVLAISDQGITTTEANIQRKTAKMLQGILTLFTDSLVRTSMPKHMLQTYRFNKKFDSTHDYWIHHLTTESAHPMNNASQLLKQVQEWRLPIATYSNSPVRLCFRLEEPASPKGKWFVRYMIQSRDDPSLLVTADVAWNSESNVLPKGVNIKEFLLTSLGRASGIFTSITEGLKDKTTSTESNIKGCAINLQKAHDFLTRESIALEQAGYGIIFPSWWTGKGNNSRIKVSAEIRAPKMKAAGMFNLKSIISFDWKIAVGGQNITIQELQKLAQVKSPLVNMRGMWMEMSTEDIKQTIKFLKIKSEKKTTLLEAIKMNLNASTASDGTTNRTSNTIDVEITSTDNRIVQILNQLNDKTLLEEEQQPDGFSGTLRPYQCRGFSWLLFLQKWGLGGCLADDMGLGKTIQILALVQKHMYESEQKDKSPFLLVCPTSVMSNWKREAARFTPDVSVMIHHGSDRNKTESAFAKNVKKYDIVVSSYGLVQRDIKVINTVKWGGAILDEAQNIKNPQTKQARAAHTIEADCKFALTGTPVENNVGDLWSIMEFLNPGFLGNQAQFKRNFFMPIQVMQDTDAAKRLKKATGPFILRRLKTDKKVISDLPEKMEMKTYCTLTKEQASLYAAVIENVEKILEGGNDTYIQGASNMKRKGLILSTLVRLKQICNHPSIFLKDNSGILSNSKNMRSGKLARLTEMLSEVIEVGDSAIVFTQFVEMGHMLKRHIQETFGHEVMFLHGGTSTKQRDEMVEKFQDVKKRAISKIFVVSLKAGGTGLNLTAANHVFHFDRWWNPAVEDQATDRAFRIGQTKKVQVHKMLCTGTLEERIDEMIEKKKEISKNVIGTGEGWITEMSNEDLRSILALSAEATVASSGDEQ